MNLKEMFSKFDSDIKLKYKNRKKFCEEFSLNYGDVNNLFGRVYRSEGNPRIDIIQMIAEPLHYELILSKKE